MKVAFLTLGCKVNYYETEKMMKDFEYHGATIVDFHDDADVYVINTCTVTNIADRKSRKMIHRAKKKNPGSIVVAVGCYVESGGEALEQDESIDMCFSNQEKENMVKEVMTYIHKLNRFDRIETDSLGECDDRKGNVERTRKYVKIQDGCNQFCSYCLIPYVRGRGVLRSRSKQEIVEEITEYAEQGYQEIVITGIHLSSYGVDFEAEHPEKISASRFVEMKGKPLLALLKEINDIKGIRRIRLGSLEPRIITEEFTRELTKVDKLCPHFHLSLQSGCDATLKRMNRHYTTKEFKEKCEILRKYFEHPAITTDVIVGFPGETEEEFLATCDFVRDIKLADIHVFPYSIRSGTKAAKMEGQVPGDVKHTRSEILISITNQLKREYQQYFLGRQEVVLLEEIQEIDGKPFFIGHNERYVRLGIPLCGKNESEYHENQMVELLVENINLL